MGYYIRVLSTSPQEISVSELQTAIDAHRFAATLVVEDGTRDRWGALVLRHRDGREIAVVEHNASRSAHLAQKSWKSSPRTYRIANRRVPFSGCCITFRGSDPSTHFKYSAAPTTRTVGRYLGRSRTTSFRLLHPFSRLTQKVSRTKMAITYCGSSMTQCRGAGGWAFCRMGSGSTSKWI